MRITIVRAAALAMVLACCAPAAARGDQVYSAPAQHPLPDLAYVLKGKLWLRSLHGGGPWSVSTPWPVSDLWWSPDGRALAFAGNPGIGVAEYDGGTLHTVFTRRLSAVYCCGELPTWSPNGRYLEFSTDTRNLSLVDRWVWDRATLGAKLLVRGASAGITDPTWSHDSTRLALSVGGYLDAPRNPLAETVDVRSGHITAIGRGVPGAWSPDDRFVGFDHLLDCGATGCFEQEDVMPSSGGRPTVLDPVVRGLWLTYEGWAPRRYGYAYDRWLLGPRGHVLRRLVTRVQDQLNRVEAWSPDGHWVAAKRVTPSHRIVLALINADTGRSRTLYVSAPADLSDAGINQGYELTWNHSSRAFALLTPLVAGYSPGGLVDPALCIYTFGSATTPARLIKAPPLLRPYPVVLGWVGHDRAVIVYSGRTLFRYVPGRQRLDPVIRDLPYSVDYSNGPPIALRSGA